MSNKQTAVEWLEIELEKLWVEKYLSPITIKPLLQQAKEMEKLKAFEIFKAGQDSMEEGGKGFEQFYEQTYGGNK
jgi:hypothetical protein